MLRFWPCAKLLETGQPISTTEPTTDYAKAVNQFTIWENNLGPIEKASVDVLTEDNKIHRILFVKEWTQVPQKPECGIV